ncbi:capsular biosynthesis protein [Rhodobacteraceae bacterium NNCM2]|nr:capsular biosynthesis protein [Coraliihabitans acroporae]
MRDLACNDETFSPEVSEQPVSAPTPRRVLLLQGPPSPFWRELGAGLAAAGHAVFKIHLCLSDQLFWRRDATVFRGRFADWAGFIDRFVAREGITDILYYADRLPYHRVAAEVAERAGACAWAIENGYLRPDWLTMEPVGMSRFSRFPRSAGAVAEIAADLPEPDLCPLYSHGFWAEAVREVAFGLGIPFGRPLYPHYRADRYYPPLQDYLSWVFRWGQQLWRMGENRRNIRRAEGGGGFVLLAMQLQSDYQIRASSNYAHLSEMLEEVIASFARNAPEGLSLVIKGHPLDNGWENWPALIRRLARDHGVASRVLWVDGGDLERMILNSSGVVTVNSTVGLLAARLGRPVIALGSAIYDIAGVTHQQGIDSFWVVPEMGHSGMTRALIRAIVARTQLRGSFFDPSGRQQGVKNVIERIEKAEEYWF